MRRFLVFLMLMCWVSMPSLAQGHDGCISSSESVQLDLTNEWFGEQNWADYLKTQVLDYLNAGGSIEGLTSTIVGSDPEIVRSQVVYVDVNTDFVDDMLHLTVLDFGGGYVYQMAVYTCQDATYQLLGDWVYREYGFGSTLELVTDTNNNAIKEIIMRSTYTPRKYYETLDFYEWNGQQFELIFQTYQQYGGYGELTLTNFDDDPTTTELIVGRIFSYGESTVGAYIELSVHRPVDMVYLWNGETYELLCEYFSDNPIQLYQVLQAAETYRECGKYDEALSVYQRIIDNYYGRQVEYGEPLLELFGSGMAFDYDAIDTEEIPQIEKDYLTAFAYYRKIQIRLYNGEIDQAWRSLESMQSQFPEGARGYRYTAMAEEIIAPFLETNDLNAACDVAEAAFNAVSDSDADPPIPYLGMVDGEPSDITLPFYWYSGKTYNSNPDNLFAVPPDISNVVSIPVCLESEIEQ